MAIRGILFDLGNTLFTREDSSIYEPLYQGLALDRDQRRELYHDLLVKQFSSFEELVQYTASKFHKPASRGFIEDICAGMTRPYEEQKLHGRLFDDVVPAVTELHRRYLLGVVSNITSPSTWILTKRTRPGTQIMTLFDSACYSCIEGVRKPGKEIYLRALHRLEQAARRRTGSAPKLEPREVVMIGDNYRNDVEDPRKHGLRARLLNREHGGLDPAGQPILTGLDIFVQELAQNSFRTPMFR